MVRRLSLFLITIYSVPILLGHDHLLCILYSWLIGRWWSEYNFIEVLKAITRYRLKWFWECWTSCKHNHFQLPSTGNIKKLCGWVWHSCCPLAIQIHKGNTLSVWTLVATTTLAEEVQWISSMPPLRHWTRTNQTSVQRTRSEILDILSLSCGEIFSPLLQDKIWVISPQLWDKIWEWPGNMANSTLHLCWGRTPGWGRWTLGIVIFRVVILYT